jgi:hypothetical protein
MIAKTPPHAPVSASSRSISTSVRTEAARNEVGQRAAHHQLAVVVETAHAAGLASSTFMLLVEQHDAVERLLEYRLELGSRSRASPSSARRVREEGVDVSQSGPGASTGLVM